MRLRNRGVAMVEAGILAPIFAMMMMMTVYLMGTYETKYRTAMMSRYAAFSYASNACTDDNFKPVYDMPTGIKNGGSTSGTGGALTQQQDETAGQGTDKYTQAADNEHGAEAGGSMFMATGKSTMTWDYTPTYKFNNGGAKSITSTSQVACNTKKSGMNPFSYISSLAGQIF
jgi:Flp pilus assembly protein TadG